MKQVHEVGAELRAALEERGCALGAAEARALSVLIIDLIAKGLLAVETAEDCRTCNTAVLNTQKEVIEGDLSS